MMRTLSLRFLVFEILKAVEEHHLGSCGRRRFFILVGLWQGRQTGQNINKKYDGDDSDFRRH